MTLLASLDLVQAAAVAYSARFWAECLLIAAGVVGLLTLALLSLAWVVARLCYWLFQIRYTCPKCGYTGTPLFLCPNPDCKRVISDLRPSLVHGIWFHRCPNPICRQVVPTLDWLGRRDLSKRCKPHEHDLTNPGLGFHAERPFAVWGAPSSGKTSLMVAALWMLEEWVHQNGWTMSFTDPAEERDFRDAVALLSQGQSLPQTMPSAGPSASFTVALEPPTRIEAGCVLYLYDAAGEDLAKANPINLQKHLADPALTGMLFVVDPFAERGARRLVGNLDPARRRWINPAPETADELLNSLLAQLALVRSRIDGRFPIHLAVTVTKIVSLPGSHPLPPSPDPRLGQPHAFALVEQRFGEIRKFINVLDIPAFLSKLGQDFERIGYFSASALSRCPDPSDRSTSRPVGVLAPLAWLAVQTGVLGGTQLSRPTAVVVRWLSGRAGRQAQALTVLAIVSILATVLGCALLAVPLGLYRIHPVRAGLGILFSLIVVFGISNVVLQVHIDWRLADRPLRNRVLFYGYNSVMMTLAVGFLRLFAAVPEFAFAGLVILFVITVGIPLFVWSSWKDLGRSG